MHSLNVPKFIRDRMHSCAHIRSYVNRKCVQEKTWLSCDIFEFACAQDVHVGLCGFIYLNMNSPFFAHALHCVHCRMHHYLKLRMWDAFLYRWHLSLQLHFFVPFSVQSHFQYPHEYEKRSPFFRRPFSINFFSVDFLIDLRPVGHDALCKFQFYRKRFHAKLSTKKKKFRKNAVQFCRKRRKKCVCVPFGCDGKKMRMP